jgi:hypothetical protein
MRQRLSKSLSPSEDDATLDVSEIDDTATTLSSQLSNSELDDATSVASATSLPSQTSHACIFDIQFDTLEYLGHLLQDVQYRSRSKRVLNTKAKVSWIYQHGADIQAKGYEKLWLCRRCHQKKAYGSQLFNATSTSSITSHLNKVHGITNSSASSQAQSPAPIGLVQRGLLPPPFNDLKYKKNLIDTITSCDLSFATVENARFRQLLISGCPEIEAILPSSHTTIRDWVLDSFQSRRVQIKDKVSLARSKVNLSLDGWRAPNRDEYIAICAHFISEDYKLVHCLLGFRKVHGDKSGQLIAEITSKVVNDYELGQNLGAFMMDNARDNDTALRELATRFDIDVDLSRLRCLGHIINLVVKALLFGKSVSKLEQKLAGASSDEAFKIWNSKGPVGKLHNICIYINRNSTRQTAFRDCQKEDFQHYQLLVDGGIRWNSTEAMISRGMSDFSSYLWC